MKKLLKSLVGVTTLFGFITPLTSCKTTSTNVKVDKTANEDNRLQRWCPVIVNNVGPITLHATSSIPVWEQWDLYSSEEIEIVCDNEYYMVAGIEKVIANYDGGEYELTQGEDNDYYLETDGDTSTIVFTESYMNNTFRLDPPDYITITPSTLRLRHYVVNIDNPIVETPTPLFLWDITHDFELTIQVKSEMENAYKLDWVSILAGNFGIRLAKGHEMFEPFSSGQYEIIQDTNHKMTLKVHGINLSQYPGADNFVITVPTTRSWEKDYNAQITTFGQDPISITNVLANDDTNFYLVLPTNFHRKKVTKVMWTTQTEFAQDDPNWRNCSIETYDEHSIMLSSSIEETEPINDDIVINFENVAPLDADHTFENEPWTELKFWVDKVYALPSDETTKEAKLREIYGLNNSDTFLGKEKEVTWGELKHTVKVASTFQLNTVKAGHTEETVLDENDVDFEHHAAFTFQFTNLLTYLDKEGGAKLYKRSFDEKWFANTNCWVCDIFLGTLSSDIRSFMRDGFISKLSHDENLNAVVKPTASSHFIYSDKSHGSDTEHYICDTFFIPTAVQMNSKKHPYSSVDNRNWHTETKGDPVFQIYENISPTDGKNDFRKFKPAYYPYGHAEAEPYWLSSPCWGNEILDWNNDKTVLVDGSISDSNQDINEAIIACFSI